MKSIVLYYSFDGFTEKVANGLAKSLYIEAVKIEPEKELKSKGFSKYIWGGRQAVMGKKPPIKPLNVDLSEYDMIYIGTPTWAGTFAPPIKTLIEDGYIKDKMVAYFYTHQGGPGKTLEKFEAAISKEGNTFLSGLDLINNKESESEAISLATNWANDMMMNM